MPAGRIPKFTDEEIVHWMTVYGNHIESVGKRLGTKYNTIHCRCRKLGLKGKGHAYLRKFTDAQFMCMFNELHGDKLELAMHFDCCMTVIKNTFTSLEITTRRQDWSRKYKRRVRNAKNNR